MILMIIFHFLNSQTCACRICPFSIPNALDEDAEPLSVYYKYCSILALCLRLPIVCLHTSVLFLDIDRGYSEIANLNIDSFTKVLNISSMKKLQRC